MTPKKKAIQQYDGDDNITAHLKTEIFKAYLKNEIILAHTVMIINKMVMVILNTYIPAFSVSHPE